MFEATLATAGIQQIGWSTLSCPFTDETGVGDAEDSYAYDGKRRKKWNISHANYGQVRCSMDPLLTVINVIIRIGLLEM